MRKVDDGKKEKRKIDWNVKNRQKDCEKVKR